MDIIRNALHDKFTSLAAEPITEATEASRKWPVFNSAHEGYAVILEEMDELWEHVKTNQKRRDVEAMRKEAVQVAATALRFLQMIDEGSGKR